MNLASLELELRTAWALARIGEVINQGRADGWLTGTPLPVASADALRSAASDARLHATPMAIAVERLALDARTADAIWLLACVEVDPALSRCVQLLVAPQTTELTVQLIELLTGVDAAALDRASTLGLVELAADPKVPTYRRCVRVADRVLELARGHLRLDRELASLATLTTPTPGALGALDLALGASRGLIVAKGKLGSGRVEALRSASARAGHDVIEVDARRLASEPTWLDRRLRLIARECRIHRALPLLVDLDAHDELGQVVERVLIDGLDRPCLASVRTVPAWALRHAITVEVPLPTAAERGALWRAHVPAADDTLVDALAARYQIGPEQVRRAASSARLASPTPSIEHVHGALRDELERDLIGIADRIETKQTWDDLVLHDDQREIVAELVSRVRFRSTVLDAWGFGDKVGRGLGLSVLLSGPPGTGKTMMAGLVAKELGLDLYQINLSKVFSKYIGETEKQLARLFDGAEAGHAILLFDEADAVFGKRTEVKSSNDRYANLEVNYLLQRVDSFSGISILTTNHESAMDEAFKRRLALHIRIPMPDEDERVALWQRMIPARAATKGDLKLRKLAEDFEMSGGYIKNAVVRAAYFAASRGEPITSSDLVRATRAEYEAMGKIAGHM